VMVDGSKVFNPLYATLSTRKFVRFIIKRIWRDYFNITCWNPPEYRGRSIPDIVKKGHMDLFICNLTKAEKCPKQCRCYYQPHEGQRIVVNCSIIYFNQCSTNITWISACVYTLLYTSVLRPILDPCIVTITV
jgi:hypothetical protein